MPSLIQAILSNDEDTVRILLEKAEYDVNDQSYGGRTPLHAAAFVDCDVIAEWLINFGANINWKDNEKNTPLHRACCRDSCSVVCLLIAYKADLTAQNNHWQTPLHIAAANNSIQSCKWLMENAAIKNMTDKKGRTALHYAAFNGHSKVAELLLKEKCIVNACDKKDCRPLHYGANVGHVETIQILLRYGADINIKDQNLYTPLHVAVASGMIDAVEVLLDNHAEINVQNAYGNTPLHIACLSGHLAICEVLINYGANIEATNYRGESPLHTAAASIHGADCLNYLIERGANINVQSMAGRTPLHMTAIHGRFTQSKMLIDKGAIVNCTDKNGCTPLHIAAQYGHDLLANTLLTFGADPLQKQNDGQISLHLSCLSGYVECCRKFLQSVDINECDHFGRTPLHCAAYKGSADCMDLLVSNGANFGVVDKTGRLPLHYAAVQGHYQCVFTLVGLGSSVNLCDAEGCTPLHLAASYDLKGECVKYLLDHKADPKLSDSRGYTPIHYAVDGGNVFGLRFLLTFLGNNFVMCGPGTPLTTPLHLAARNGNQDILQLLLPYFHDINVRTEKGSTALLLASKFGHTDCVQMLLRYGARVAICDSIHKMSPIHYSSLNGHMFSLALLLDNAEDKTVINLPDGLQRTALMLAASGGKYKCIKVLLKSNADPNAVDGDNHSSLFKAVYGLYSGTAELLISHGAHVNTHDVNGKTVLHLAAARGGSKITELILKHMDLSEATSLDQQELTALHWACYSGSAVTISLLLQSNSFPKLTGNPFSPVHCAIIGGKQCLELLCNYYGSSIVNLKDARNRTPLHIASLHGQADCAKYLLENGAELDCRDTSGRTPLIIAAQNGQNQIIDLLLNSQCDTKACDNNENTALHLACLKKHNQCALLLLQHIDNANIVNMANKEGKTPLHLSARNGLVSVTSELIKKGSSVLALDVNGMTPALCCAPDNNVAQCLAIILANYSFFSDKEKENKLTTDATYPTSSEGLVYFMNCNNISNASIDLVKETSEFSDNEFY